MQKKLESLAKQREQFNPFRELTMARAIGLRDSIYRGDHSQVQWFFHRMMKSCATLSAVRARREAAIQRLDWHIHITDKLPAGCTPEDGAAQATVLRSAYDKIDNMARAFSFLSLASFHGFSIMQKHRDGQGNIFHLEPLDQWNWIRDGYRGQWLWNPSANPNNADSLKREHDSAIDPAEFVTLEYDTPILETAIPLFVRDVTGSKDWSHFVDVFGIPGAFVIGPPNIPPDKEDDYRDAAQAVADGGSGYLPNGSMLSFATDARENSPYKNYLDDQRSQIVLVGTGGRLTMLVESNTGTLASGAHQDAFDEIVEAEAARISEAFQRSIDSEVLSNAFPDMPQLAYFKLGKPDESDPVKAADMILSISKSGFMVDAAQASERTGYRLTLRPTPAVPKLAPVAAPVPPQAVDVDMVNRAEVAAIQAESAARLAEFAAEAILSPIPGGE